MKYILVVFTLLKNKIVGPTALIVVTSGYRCYAGGVLRGPGAKWSVCYAGRVLRGKSATARSGTAGTRTGTAGPGATGPGCYAGRVPPVPSVADSKKHFWGHESRTVSFLSQPSPQQMHGLPIIRARLTVRRVDPPADDDMGARVHNQKTSRVSIDFQEGRGPAA